MTNIVNKSTKRVWLFRDGDKSMRDLLGGKGANLAEMTNIGLPVPPGFTIATEVCTDYYANGKRIPYGLMDEVKVALADVEAAQGKKLGDPSNPLLLSVRSGAKFSMPGMMDTVLNLGLNNETAVALAEASGNPRFVYDSYRRLIMMLADVAYSHEADHLSKHDFEHMFRDFKTSLGVTNDLEVDADSLKKLCDDYLAHFKKQTGKEFPQDVFVQLEDAITAVFRSWNNDRANIYRQREKIPHEIGTAVNVQAMVFGNMGDDCGTGVAFTRNPSTGENVVFGEYLINAHGEDVVAGVRTPQTIEELASQNPAVYQQFDRTCKILEDHYKDMQDIEFTIEKNKFFILQYRSGKRTGPAAIKIAVDMLAEGILTEMQTVLSVRPESVEAALVPRLSSGFKDTPVARGLPAGPGVGTGVVAFDADTVRVTRQSGLDVIFVCTDLNRDDFDAALMSAGLLTSRGGMTSHAALLARGFSIPTVAGCYDIQFDISSEARSFRVHNLVVPEYSEISVDGASGAVYLGRVPVTNPLETSGSEVRHFAQLVFSTDTQKYIDHDIAHLWRLRDIFRRAQQRYKPRPTPGFQHRRNSHGRAVVNLAARTLPEPQEAFVRFRHPSEEEWFPLVSTLKSVHNRAERDVAEDFLKHLYRILQDVTGIGNHPRVVRPLLDPSRAFLRDGPPLRPAAGEEEATYQLVGTECFNIGYFSPNHLNWSTVQWFGLFTFRKARSADAWRLDRTNPRGESLIRGSGQLEAYRILLNGVDVPPHEMKSMYNELRQREQEWIWFRDNGISSRIVRDDLKRILNGETLPAHRTIAYQEIGLLENDKSLTEVGRASVVELLTPVDFFRPQEKKYESTHV